MKNIVIQNHSIEKSKSPIETGQPNHAHAANNGGWPTSGKSSFKASSISASFHDTSPVGFDSRETIDYTNEPSIWSKNDSRGPVSNRKFPKFSENFPKSPKNSLFTFLFRAQFLPQFKGHTKMIFGHQTISPN